MFAIEEINRNPHLLPNISLGYEIHNVQHSEWTTLESSLKFLSGTHEIPNYKCGREEKSAAVLTGTAWETSVQIGALLELYKFPQVMEDAMGSHKFMLMHEMSVCNKSKGPWGKLKITHIYYPENQF